MSKNIYAVSFILCVAYLFTNITVFAQQDGTATSERFFANYAITPYRGQYNNFPGDEANAVVQTRDGFIWFGGYGGLHRYNGGANFTSWTALTPNGFGSSSIRALYEDANGVLWIGTNDRGIVAFEHGVFTVYGRADGLPSSSVRAITGDAYGRIWGGTADGIFYIDSERNITHMPLDTNVSTLISSLAVDGYGNVFAVLGGGEVYILTLDGQTIRHGTENARTVGIMADGRVLIGMRDGVAVILCDYNPQEIPLPYGSIESVFVDSNDFTWILSTDGIGFFDTDKIFHSIGNPNGAGFYTDMWEDYQSGFWFTATRGGITRLAPSAFTRVGGINANGGPSNAVVSWNDLIIIGTDAGLTIFDADWNTLHEEFSDMFETRIRGITVCSQNYVWIATHADWGIVRFNPADGTYTNWTPEDGLSTERTRFVQEISDGVIVVGTAAGIDFIKDDVIVSAHDVFGTDAEIRTPGMMVLSTAYTTDGTLFAGTDGDGIYAVNRNGYTRVTEEDGLTGGIVLRVLYDAELDGVWAAASPGLSFIDAENNVHAIEKVPPLTFLDIMRHGDDLLLMYSGAIFLTNAADLLDPYVPFEYETIYRGSGLTALINANAWNMVTDDGRLFFNTDRGVQLYNFESEPPSFIPNVGIAEIYIDGVKQTNFFNETVVIPRGSYRLTIQMSLLSFGFADDSVLRFILEGQDSTPYTLTRGSNMEISYTNIRGGDYTLRVWSEDFYGNIGHYIEVEFFKERSFFEHIGVWIVLAALALLIMYGISISIVRYRTRILLARQQEYRQILSQSLKAIVNTIDAKDSYTSGHSARVAAYSVELARRMSMSDDFIENMYYIGLLHDVGKIGISNYILNKPGRLTNEEYETIKTHTTIGFEILKGITAIPNLTAGAVEHHERWDGKGYVSGKSSDDISLEARIISVADVYDAMASDRAYREALPKSAILEEFRRCAGYQFDPAIAAIAIAMIENDEFEKINTEDVL
ncbi:MAG: HD domain-containing protein [Defluviitaleaceae bacterium]|nr:HD domain-containing protein [Defluviitaleaceae bacterium]MCL2262053.1 HD domain-containing protein [Defluviitaleaceae bacterium]